MKVLYVVNVYPDAKNPAAEPFVKAQIDSVRRAGADIEVFNVRGNESKLNYVKALRKVRSYVRSKTFDVVHGHYVYSGWIAAFQGRVPSVVSFMGSDLLGTRKGNGKITLRGCGDSALSRLLMHHVDGIIVKSREMVRKVSTEKPLVVIPNGVDFKSFQSLPMNDCRKKLGLENDSPTVLFVGKKSSPNKGYALVEEAVRFLSQELHCNFVVAQNIPHRDIPLYMNASDVLVLASQYEGSPNVVKEALACNLPVVATDAGDVRNLLSGVAGCHIVDRTAKSIAEGIQAVFGSKIRCNGREAIQHLREELIAERIVSFYQKCIERKRNLVI